MGTYNNPDQWATLNDMTATANTFTCLKGSPGSPGFSYIKLISKNVTGMGIIPGLAISGMLDSVNMQPLSGFPYTGRPESLDGRWQYMASGSDQGYISVLFTLWNSTTLSRDTISFTYFSLPGMAMSWANFSIPINYQSDSFPDSVVIVLSASNANGAPTAANSYLYIDDLTFENVLTSVADDIAQSAFQLYPNPAHSMLNVELPEQQSPTLIEIFDLKGNLIQSYIATRQGIISQDISTLPLGTYLLRVHTEKSILTRKFIRE
jgi:hypothetical protein